MARFVGTSLELAAHDEVMRRLDRAIEKDGPRVVRLALGVLSRQLKSGRARMSTAIRSTINLKKKQVDQYIKAKTIWSDGLPLGNLRAVGAQPELAAYLSKKQIAAAWAKQQKTKGRKPKGVKVKTRKDKPGRVYVGAFVNVGTRSGRWHVMSRVSAERSSARILRGPSITKDLERELGKFTNEEADRFSRELTRVLDRRLEILK
jgi:hypothetical protein